MLDPEIETVGQSIVALKQGAFAGECEKGMSLAIHIHCTDVHSDLESA